MKKTLKTVAATAVVALGLGMGSAHAGPIFGGISPSDGLGSVSASAGAVINDLNSIDVAVSANTNASCVLSFAGCSATWSSFDFSIVPVAADTIIFTGDGFAVHLTGISSIIRTALACDTDGLCSDSLVFNWTGYITKVGFDPTLFAGKWTGNGACSDFTGDGLCDLGTKTGSWSSSVTSLGRVRQVPEPGTLALLGLGLAGIGFAFRRKQA
ncbi:MAG: PEP-CTERM sorting domain-containing protein [Betaproteobacteria bacterium]